MKIESIHITNFRGIKDLDIPITNNSINLFVGINGAGKSSVLDVIAYVLSWFLARIKNPKSSGWLISEQDINNESSECTISVKVRNHGEWVLYRARPYAKSYSGKTELHDMMDYIAQLHQISDDGGSIPVVMYYPVDRAIDSAPAHLKRNKQIAVIWDAYENALKGNADFRSFFEWYRKQEDDENEHIRDNRSYEDAHLRVIRQAIEKFFPSFGNLRVRRNPQRFVIEKKGEMIEFNQMSQGEKCYLALICDLARRFAMANPHSVNPLEGEGIVLIDEVDLHLHPTWQMEIVGKLHDTFPNCQFFLSSHSPHILSDLNASQVFLLNDGDLDTPAFNPYGKLVNEVLANYFSISKPRNVKVNELIDNAYQALKKGDKENFEQIYAHLSEVLNKVDTDMVNLKIQALRSFK